MNIDVRQIILNTIFTISTKTGRKIITWEDIANYTYMLEKRFNTKINLSYTENFNVELYEKVITTEVLKDNVCFKVNPRLTNFKFSKNLIDINLLLDKKSNERLIEIDNTLKNIPSIKTINFISLFKLFILIYIKKGNTSIDRTEFWKIMTNIKNTLNKCGIEVKNATKLELFRTVYMYDKSQKFDLKDNNINSNIVDIEKFEKETIYSYDEKTLNFISNIINYNLIGKDFEINKTK